eukprot:CAMPEP_0171019082 /NCGR_PEP_ID=MMETSP0736-20130129/28814_1 /TAXON_ID=186038 /ORGANISM="Fragilariopsis kerguelensis, Strain L26-C5" /LENGTH=157 /DNA_ID=CAMNT_0011456037 /DNA_START=511 /DNA_END=985 /DNA_ORIENTATION=+
MCQEDDSVCALLEDETIPVVVASSPSTKGTSKFNSAAPEEELLSGSTAFAEDTVSVVDNRGTALQDHPVQIKDTVVNNKPIVMPQTSFFPNSGLQSPLGFFETMEKHKYMAYKEMTPLVNKEPSVPHNWRTVIAMTPNKVKVITQVFPAHPPPPSPV